MIAEALDHNALRKSLEAVDMASLTPSLIDRTQHIYSTQAHGHWEKWRRLMAQLTDIATPSTVATHDFNRSAIRIGDPQCYQRAIRAHIKQLLLQLTPWRKGPFDFFGILIDSEWRSNLKWSRLVGKLGKLQGRRIVDVGCGNGYYLWRMLGAQASLALGIDPSQLFIAQFTTLKRYCPDSPAFILPLTSEQFSQCYEGGGADCERAGFDVVFSMGVLSHRRNPLEHLRELLKFTRCGGELVIETLVVDGDQNTIFVNPGRYAKMRNVYSIPSTLALEKWLQQVGLTDIHLIDVSKTTSMEQRTTEWMPFESLADFLSPTEANKTIEGHPGPQRAIFVCRKA